MNAEGKAVPDPNVGSRKRVVELYSKLTEFLDQPRPGLRDAGAHRWATSLYRQLVELHETVSRTKRTVDERETLTKLALVNAIYFKGDWTHRFDKGKTARAPFFGVRRSGAEIPLMELEDTLLYAEREGPPPDNHPSRRRAGCLRAP